MAVLSCAQCATAPLPSFRIGQVTGVPEAPQSGPELADALARALFRRGVSAESGPEVSVRVTGFDVQLDPFFEPAARAGRSYVRVNLHASWAAGPSQVRAVLAQGEALVVSRPGPIERTEGAVQRARRQATDDAARRLVAAIIQALHRDPDPAEGST
ncbi:MAG: hypothetical protein ACFB9M_12060 [Myxococcota bacterium]